LAGAPELRRAAAAAAAVAEEVAPAACPWAAVERREAGAARLRRAGGNRPWSAAQR